jgi:hypothetical protein
MVFSVFWFSFLNQLLVYDNLENLLTNSACSKGKSYKFPLWATKHTGKGKRIQNALSKCPVLLSNPVWSIRLLLSKPVSLETSGIIVAIAWAHKVSLFKTPGKKVFTFRICSWLFVSFDVSNSLWFKFTISWVLIATKDISEILGLPELFNPVASMSN